MQTQRMPALHKLSDAKLTVKNPEEDVRGRKVLDKAGQDVGSVEDLMIDDVDYKVRFLQVASGGFLGIGVNTLLIPVDAVTRIMPDAVHIDQTRERLVGAPSYNPALATGPVDLEVGDYTELYGYFGYAPYWDANYQYPTYPRYDHEIIDGPPVAAPKKV